MKRAFKIILCVLLGVIIIASGYIFLFTGNAFFYAPCFQKQKSSDLQGKTVLFLGSSVTLGFGSFNDSFADYLERQYSLTVIKEAVNGTTLVDNGENSYISRLKSIDKELKLDMLICQLSTNDATKNSPFGEVGESFEISDFDTSTVAGAIEYIICYTKNTFNCHVGFYTQLKYDSENYRAMYNLLMDIQEKWDIPVLDFWSNVEVNSHNAKRHMVDDIHPTMLCYRDCLAPEFYRFIKENIFGGTQNDRG